MEIFTKEHELVREKYNTKQRVDEYKNSIMENSIPFQMITWIENLKYFFFATSNKNGATNVNFKGSKSDTLIKVIDTKTIIFPDYEGNGIFHGVGDIQSNPNVGLLCIDFLNEFRVKISGKATVIDDKEELSKYLDEFDTFDIPRIIKIDIEYFIPNCSQQLSVVKDEIIKNME